jgi:hypothetical protein
MNQNNLSGFFFPAVAGLFFFMKRPSINEVDVVHTNYPVYSKDTSGLSGVAKYLDFQDKALQAKLHADELAQHPDVLMSSVSRYLQDQNKHIVTGVAKYMLRQSIVEKQQKQTLKANEGSSVERYLKNRKNAPELSGVAKYLKHQASLPQPSNVAKYMAKKAAVDALKAKISHVEVTGVAKYLNHQASLPQPSKVARYLAMQTALAAKQVQPIVAKNELTGVSKYLQHQDSLPQPSRVAKYMTRQILLEQQKPTILETGVDKYMRHQEG